jgi:hypothetical protein
MKTLRSEIQKLEIEYAITGRIGFTDAILKAVEEAWKQDKDWQLFVTVVLLSLGFFMGMTLMRVRI